MANSIHEDARLRTLLDELHAASEAQETETLDWLRGQGIDSIIGTDDQIEAGRPFWVDKYVALDRDKAEMCYLLCRTRGAKRVIEAGTSFGVSTLYLAAAMRDNGGGVVTGTEWEATKAAAARENFRRAGYDDVIDLREGDLRQTLAADDGPVDALLLDIWTPMVRPTLDLVAPRIALGGFIIADNTAVRRYAYAELFDFLHDPAQGFTTMTLPFTNGLEFAVRTSTPSH